MFYSSTMDRDSSPEDSAEGLGCEHGAEHREGQIKRMVADPLQVASGKVQAAGIVFDYRKLGRDHGRCFP